MDLDRRGDVWTYKPALHKTEHHGKSRTVFLGPHAQAVLLRYLARDAQTHCFRPCDSEQKRRAAQHASRKTPLSCGNKPGSNRKRKPRWSAGQRYDVAAYRRAIHHAADRAGIPRWSPNRLRHSAGTEIRQLYGLEAAQVCLGHSKADVTQVYAERDYALAARVAKEVG
jgi:integrase